MPVEKGMGEGSQAIETPGRNRTGTGVENELVVVPSPNSPTSFAPKA